MNDVFPNVFTETSAEEPSKSSEEGFVVTETDVFVSLDCNAQMERLTLRVLVSKG